MNDAPVITHKVEGDGPPLLVLNGGMMSIPSWEPLLPRFRDRFRLIRCDFRGQLMSPGEAHRSFDVNVADVLRLLDALELDAVHVLGASFGAQNGLLLAARHPDRVHSLIAVTAADRDDGTLREAGDRLRGVIERVLEGGDRGELHDLLVQEVYSPAYVEAHRDELDERRGQIALLPAPWFRNLHGILDCLDGMDLTAELQNIRCPCLVLGAGQDGLMPPERVRALAAAVPGARLEMIDRSGHALVVERPDPLIDACLSFLEGVIAS